MSDIVSIDDVINIRSRASAATAVSGALGLQNVNGVMSMTTDQGVVSVLAKVPSLPAGMTSLFAFGDSHTVGTGSSNGYPATANNVQIMMGIGGDGTTGYLDRLYDLISGAGISVVGPLGSGTDTQFFRGGVAATSFNRLSRQHEGHSGWGLSVTGGFVAAGSAMASQFATLWAANPAAAIILMGGTNEMNNGATGAQAATSLLTCLQQIATTAGNSIPVLFVKPASGSGVSAKQAAFSAAVDVVVAAQQASGQKVWSCDAGAILKDGNGGTAGALFFDALHPNYHGYRVLAGIIFKGLIACPY